MKATVSGVVEELRTLSLKFQKVRTQSLAETANWAESGKHQFGSEPSEILNLRSSTTPETVSFMPP